MHFKQRLILKLLEEKNGQRYSELYRYFEYEDKFPYHIKRLLQNRYVNKREGLYYITKRGIQEKEFYDGRNLKDVNSKCPRFIFIVHYLGKYYLKECLRPKSFYILPGGTPVKGETVQDSCRRILYDKYGLIGEVEYRCAHHYINYTSDRDVLFDNICLVFDVELKKSYRKQDSWFTMDQIKKLKQIHPTIHKFILEDAREPFSTLAFVHDYGFEKEDSK